MPSRGEDRESFREQASRFRSYEAERKQTLLEIRATMDVSRLIELATAASAHPDPATARKVPRAAFERLTDIGGEEVVHALGGLLDAGDVELESGATATLARLDAEAATPYLMQALGNGREARTRLRAAEELVRRNHPPAMPLVTALLDSHDPATRINAAGLLIKSNDPDLREAARRIRSRERNPSAWLFMPRGRLWSWLLSIFPLVAVVVAFLLGPVSLWIGLGLLAGTVLVLAVLARSSETDEELWESSLFLNLVVAAVTALALIVGGGAALLF